MNKYRGRKQALKTGLLSVKEQLKQQESDIQNVWSWIEIKKTKCESANRMVGELLQIQVQTSSTQWDKICFYTLGWCGANKKLWTHFLPPLTFVSRSPLHACRLLLSCLLLVSIHPWVAADRSRSLDKVTTMVWTVSNVHLCALNPW